MRLDDCYQGFREDYLGYEALTRQLEAWAEAFPGLARLASLGRTPEDREIWLLTVGPEPDRVRPAVWVDGNMHSGEVSGSSVALPIAGAAPRLHVDEAPPLAYRCADSRCVCLSREAREGEARRDRPQRNSRSLH